MAPYFAIFALLAVCSFIDVSNVRKEQRNFVIFGLCVILIFFAGLRYGDHDYVAYQLIFAEAQQWDLGASPDLGYTLLNGILGQVWNDPLIVFLTVAALSVSLNAECFNEYGKYALVALLFYFVHNYALKEMIQIRAGLACAVGLWNIRNMRKGRYGRFWLWQLIAMLIHLGAVMFLLAWLIKQLNWSKRTWMFVLAGCFVVGTVYPFGAILKSLPGMSVLERVQTYTQWDEYAESLGILTNMATLKQLFICGAMLFFYDLIKGHVKYFDLLMAMYFASTCWLMVWNDFAIVGARMATFLSVGEPILIAGLLYTVTERSRPVMLGALIVVAFLFLWVNMQGKILPYQFYPSV